MALPEAITKYEPMAYERDPRRRGKPAIFRPRVNPGGFHGAVVQDQRSAARRLATNPLHFSHFRLREVPFGESPYQLNAASRAVARRTGAKPAAYGLALRQAKAACRLEPNSGAYLNTLGVAQYRSGKYPEALKTFMHADKINFVPPGGMLRGGSDPRDLAFLAMTKFQLGQKDEAAATV